MGADGTMAAIWLRADPAGAELRAEVSVRAAGEAAFGVPEFVSADGFASSDMAIAVAPDGTVIALWREDHGSNALEYWARVRAPGQASFGPPDLVSVDDQLATPEPSLEVAADGRRSPPGCSGRERSHRCTTR